MSDKRVLRNDIPFLFYLDVDLYNLSIPNIDYVGNFSCKSS